jgi:hypothetical protein
VKIKVKSIIKNKKGISIVVGYVLLITLGIIMSVIVYAYLKTYIPKEPIKCPDTASISIKEIFCNVSLNYFNLTLKNNGNFDLHGFFIYGAATADQELAVQDLSGFANNNSNISEPAKYGNSIRFSNIKNSLGPGEEKTANFTLDYPIYSLEIIPLRYQGEGNKEKLVSCTDARIKQKLTCW